MYDSNTYKQFKDILLTYKLILIVFFCFQSWPELLQVEDEIKRSHSILFYFIDGLGPLVRAFCKELAAYKGRVQSQQQYRKILVPRIELLTSVGHVIIVSPFYDLFNVVTIVIGFD